MKRNLKSKTVPKGSQKISNFFKKISTSENPNVLNQKTKLEVISSDSEEDFVIDKPSTSKSCRNDKENISSCDIKIQDHASVREVKKRKTELHTTFLVEESPSEILPTLSEYDAGSVINVRAIISVKSPEKLLSPQVLRQHQQELDFKDNEKTPKKWTPDKTKTKKISPKGSPSMKNKSGINSKTPKKLFDRSPNNINEFNTEVINSYVKITPSKSSEDKKTADVIFVKSSHSKKQSSILKYMSPSPPKSLQVQARNETTPTRITPVSHTFRTTPPVNKVKTKLDFGDTSVKVDDCFECDDNWDSMIDNVIPDFKLNLTESQHCKIININPFSNKSILTLKSTKTDEQAVCNLEGFWVHSILGIGDTVHVQAKKVSDMQWVVNNEYGFLVYEPDLLISTTSVVNSVWCRRRSVLSEKFRSIDPGNEVMLIGTLVHNVFQSVLRHKVFKRDGIENYIKKIICEPSVLKSLYECNLSVDHVEKELCKFIPNIEEFVSQYLEDFKIKSSSYKKDNWKGTIINIEDIEENIWSPELGLKGKVDITVTTNTAMMPLEIKTGRATVSLEHRGQVIMYTMMMNKLGYNVPSGLLLYIREGVLREIPTTAKEKRDLILLRNELTYYLTRKPKFVNSSHDNFKIQMPELPDTINHPSCERCPYKVLCTSFATYNQENISSNKILKNIQDEVSKTLNQSHLDYFMKWVLLLSLEANSDTSTKKLREIYMLTPVQRETSGRCITHLKVVAVEECNDMYEHTFKKPDNPEDNFYSKGIAEGSYVVVSTDVRPAVSSGFVTNITMISISVSLDRDLIKKYPNHAFHIDSYDSNSLETYNLASLSLLLEMTPRAQDLRKIIVDKCLPTYKVTLPKLIGIKGKSILQRLNIVQQRAVLKAIAAENYFLIKGMPGTGKTSTIVALIQLLYELNKSILITSHTHSAVDNVCLKLLNYNLSFLRLGSISKIDPRLIPYSEHHLIKQCVKAEDFEKIYNDAQIIAVTCLGCGHPLLSKRTLDVCIVDESTQVLQSSVIRPLYAANTFILIGDPDQLPAVVKSKEALDLGMSESLFERLYTEESSVALNLNYRMNSRITAVANHFTYNQQLLVGSEDIAKMTVKLPNKDFLSSLQQGLSWILPILDDTLEEAVQIIDTGPVWKLQHDVPWKINNFMDTHKRDTSREDFNINIYEAAVTVVLVRALLRTGVNSKDIGVIVTYRLQVSQVSNLLKTENVLVNTVDQFQGQDRSIIIFSCVKSKNISSTVDKYELLEDKKRINVAITRAKHKLIILGDLETLNKYSTFKKLVPYLENKIIRLKEWPGFTWESVLSL